MNALVETSARQLSVIGDMADRFGMDKRAFEATLMATVMPSHGKDVSQEQVAAFLLVAKKYALNPFTKEIYAFPAKGGGIQPIVSIDGWLKIINDHPQFDGMEFDDKFDGEEALTAVTCRIFRKDRGRPVEVTEYMAECKRPTEPWQKWPARMLRHKAAIQAARYAFGFSGIMEPDEAERMDSVVAKAAVVMPRAKSERAVAFRSPESFQKAEDDGPPAPIRHEQVTEQAPGIHGLSDSLIRVLVESAKQVGITQEQLLQRYVRIDPANYKTVRAELQAMASVE